MIAQELAGKSIVKYLKLNGLITVLGIVLITIYFTIFLWMGGFFGLMLPCYIINGIVGMNIHKRELMVKHSKLFGFITVLGAVFVTLFSAIVYLSFTTGLGGMMSSLSLESLLFFLLIGGTVFFTAGILGIGNQYFKNHKGLFAVLTVILVPLFIFALINLVMSYSIPLTVGI